MIVRNILVFDRSVFEEELIKQLIDYGISYVHFENEFHFGECIYRFFDDKDILLSDDPFALFSKLKEETEEKEEVLSSSKIGSYSVNNSCKPKYNKQLIKRDNRKANLKLK